MSIATKSIALRGIQALIDTRRARIVSYEADHALDGAHPDDFNFNLAEMNRILEAERAAYIALSNVEASS